MTDRPAGRPWIGISGAVPTLKELEANGWNESNTRQAVQLIAEIILERGGGLVHGNHPTFTPLIKGVASRNFRAGESKRVRIFASRFFYGPHAFGIEGDQFDPETGQYKTEVSETKFLAEHELYADVRMTGAPDMGRLRKDLGAALTEMRRAMLDHCAALVCIGGRLEGASLTPVPGVKEEFDIACARGIPVYLVGTGGGCALRLFGDLGDNVARLHNELGLERNRHLAKLAPCWEAASLIADDLARLGALKAPEAAPATTHVAGSPALLASTVATASGVPPAPEKPAPDVSHLNMIQGVINRLADNSFNIKGWSVAVLSALLGLAVNNNQPSGSAAVALIPAVAFWVLDAYYLMLERRYRKLFSTVVQEAGTPVADRRIAPFNLDSSLVKDEVENLIQTVLGLNRNDPNQVEPKPWRLAVVGTHLPLVFVVVTVFCLIGFGALKPKDPDKLSSPKPAPPANASNVPPAASATVPAPAK